ncbi:glycoside hydrolase family 97 protein [Agromyces soli]|uniref:Glycoside hydrolase family 97 catalytic domain-containing protein n=1 Tax=Agromyces soli TaxID=659012 RepID=A0ABY4AW41_9MICO|nr:glycoside hydrolase family 97 protein [Agromyces soli]UOE27049.1 glycoside hydrolase family 97 catalytic domain-containing protein [Agromyces soli]
MSWTVRSQAWRAALVAILVAGMSAVALEATPAQAVTPGSWEVAQPGATGTCGGTRAALALDSNGRLTLAAARDCVAALDPGQLALRTTSVDFTQQLDFVARSDRTVFDDYTMVSGKSRQRSRAATISTFTFARGGVQLVVIVRVSQSGVAVRYALPNAATVIDDATEFQFPSDTSITTARYAGPHETPWGTTTVGALGAGSYEFGSVLRRSNGMAVQLAEGDPDGTFPGGALNRWGASGFEVALATASVPMAAGAVTPWRVVSVGSPADLFQSTLVDDVARPSKITDTSWIKPGISAWNWLDGYEAGQASLAQQKAWVDYASKQGWAYSLVDGGWKGQSWVPELVAYAAERNVGILLWVHSADLETAAQRESTFTTFRDWGVKGVKIDFMDSDSLSRYAWYEATLEDTARFQLMVDFHGSRLPQGSSRTWPHLLTSEAIRGGEFLGDRTIAHVAAAPFTRGALGGTDYTPLGFQNGKPNSDAVELAQTVLYDTGLLLPAGTRSSYAARPISEWWMRSVPVVWDETRLVGGTPETGAVVARRSDERWYLGAMKAGAPGNITYSTAFLGSGQWLAEVVDDAPNGTLRRTTQVVTAGAALTIPTAVANGGHAIRFTRVVSAPAEATRIRLDGSGLALNVAYASSSNGAAIVQWPASADPNSSFSVAPLGDGYVRIIAKHSGRDVVILDAGTSPGAVAVQHDYGNAAVANDEWLLEDAGGGRFRIVNRLSGLVLAAVDSDWGTQLRQVPYRSGDTGQLFWFG